MSTLTQNSKTKVKGYAALGAKEKFVPFEYELGELGENEVEIEVKHCGICHSDLSLLDNEWGITRYPFVGGHEVIGTIRSLGRSVPELKPGETVGVGWHSESCMHCSECLSGDQNLCATAQPTILGRYGGFSNIVRCHWAWAIPLPKGCKPEKAGPLLCAGVTVFNPILQFGIKGSDRVGVVGIGGLGHLAIEFLNKWGCEVTAFSRTSEKENEARSLGAHQFILEDDAKSFEKFAGNFDYIISTVNAPLNWDQYINLLGPKGRFHTVGVIDSLDIKNPMALIGGQKSISGSPVGSPSALATMLEFASRHQIEPITEHYPLTEINTAFDRLRSGKARYRIVLDV